MMLKLALYCAFLGTALFAGIAAIRFWRNARRLDARLVDALERSADAQRTAGEMNDIVRKIRRSKGDHR